MKDVEHAIVVVVIECVLYVLEQREFWNGSCY